MLTFKGLLGENAPCSIGASDEPGKLHHHDFYKIIMVTEGFFPCSIEGDLYVPVRGEILLISPNELHQNSCPNSTGTIEICFSRELVNQFCISDNCFKISASEHRNLFCADGETLNKLFSSAEILRQEIDNPDQRSALMTLASLVRILVVLDRCSGKLQGATQKDTEAFYALEFIRNNLTQALSLELVAKNLCLNRNSLNELFKRSVGVSVHRYIIKRRLLFSKELILNGHNASEASALSGFSDYSSYFRAFKNEYGISPAEFDKEQKIKPGLFRGIP